MAKEGKHIINRRLLSSYVSSVISIGLVLLLVGVAALLLVNARGVADYFRENLRVAVMLVPDADESSARDFADELSMLPFVKAVEYVSPEQGAAEMAAQLGDDFLSVFESSPLPSSLELSIRAGYMASDSLASIVDRISSYGIVEETVYQESLVEALNANLGKISVLLLLFIALLLFVSFVLINNTVRLNVFSHRFSIHTMKLVGATRSFIRHPFMVQALFQGLFASSLATGFLLAGLFVLKSEFIELFTIFTLPLFLTVAAVVFATGVLLCLTSTFFSVNRMVSFSRDDLYI
ncbi:MAG: cell division protein FtsX [Bacteroidales bacterium]|nr:cell division protein FtsX [Bacteroidales bacterium]